MLFFQVEKFINKKTSVTTDFTKSKLHQVKYQVWLAYY